MINYGWLIVPWVDLIPILLLMYKFGTHVALTDASCVA
jgi:hypothetical protein